jgi:hypothetical protein
MHVFSHTWRTDPKDKHIHKNKHDHTQTHMYNTYTIVELWNLEKEGEEKRM